MAMKKRHARDRDRTPEEIAKLLSKVHSINPETETGLFELRYQGNPRELLAADLIVLDVMKVVATKGRAYRAIHLYDLVKYSSDIDERLAEIRAGPWSNSAAFGSNGVRPTLTRLWQNGYIRKFAKGFFSQGAGGRPYKVHYQIW